MINGKWLRRSCSRLPMLPNLEQRDVYRVFGIKISPLATKEIKRAHNPSSVVQ